MITDHLTDLVRSALERAFEGPAESATRAEIRFERPKRREHGDWSTNVALTASKTQPRVLAQQLADLLPASDFVASVDVAGPGFINFHLAPKWLHDVVRRAADPVAHFGHSRSKPGHKVNVEYVSANPTGPINVVSGRHAAYGDAVSNLLEAAGNEVVREFYINDTGRQAALFGMSLAARFMQALGHEAEIPEDGYHGEYLKDLADSIAAEKGDDLVTLTDDERAATLGKMGLEHMLAEMKRDLASFGTEFDVWFAESQLHESGAIEWGISDLKQLGYIEERDDALWFLASAFGDDKDRVVVRSSGEPTYLAADIAYLLNKFERGFHHLIYVWGADHHGTVARLMAAEQALGFEPDRIEVRLVQVVTLSSGGTSLKASKRQGVLVPLSELVEEVGRDAARYMFLTRSIDAPLDFDIELAKEQAPENPVYYVQYAHARISSILRLATEQGVRFDPRAAKLDLLTHASEDELMRKLASYEEVLPDAAAARAPQKLTRYVEELASVFSGFYRDCKVVSDDRRLTEARLTLCVATRSVIADALGLLGVGAPERM